MRLRTRTAVATRVLTFESAIGFFSVVNSVLACA